MIRIVSSASLMEGNPIPKYYGRAYSLLPTFNGVVFAIIPLNIILGLARKVWLLCRYGLSKSKFENLYDQAYIQGVRHGVDTIKDQFLIRGIVSKEVAAVFDMSLH